MTTRWNGWLRIAGLLVILVAFAGCGTDPDDDDAADDDAADDDTGDDDAEDAWAGVDELVAEHAEEAKIIGLAAAVTRPGEVLWLGTYGLAHVQDGRAVTVDTPFMLASASKTVTATAVMQLWEDGALAFDDAVNDIVPFALDNPRVEGETIAVRHLVTHTSGIRDNWGLMPYSEGDSPYGLGEFLEGYLVDGGSWYDATANFTTAMPGAAWEYGNVATALAGYLVEASTGTAFDDHCDDQIFAPLQMENTGWHLADFDEDELAMPYEVSGNQQFPYGHYGYPDYPDGQLRTSIHDLARFLAAVTADGELEGSRILEEATAQQMFEALEPGADPVQYVFWYGETIAGRSVIGHNGGDNGVATEMFFDPATGIGVIVLMNVDWTTPVEAACAAIQELLFERGEAVAQ